MITIATRQDILSIRKQKKLSRRKWSVYIWRGRHYDSSKCCELLVQRRGVTSQKTWTYGLEKFWGKKKLEGYEYTPYQLATQYSATSTHNTTTYTWMVSPYTPYQLATQYSATSTHNTKTYTWMVSPYTPYQLATQYSATSTHKTTNSIWVVSPYTQHINSQLIKMQPAHTTSPPPLGWCHHIHNISNLNSIKRNQYTQHHHLHLDGVTIYAPYQLATQ